MAATDMNMAMRARMMSRRQRVIFLMQLVKVPNYMRKRFLRPTTKAQLDFVELWNDVALGKAPCDVTNVNQLNQLLETADKERYATSPALVEMPS